MMRRMLLSLAILSLLYAGKVAYDMTQRSNNGTISEQEVIALMQQHCEGHAIVTGTTVNIYGIQTSLNNGDGGPCALHVISSMLSQYPQARKFAAHWEVYEQGRLHKSAIEYDRQQKVLRRIGRRAGRQPSIETYKQVSNDTIRKAAESYHPVGQVVRFGAVRASPLP